MGLVALVPQKNQQCIALLSICAASQTYLAVLTRPSPSVPGFPLENSDQLIQHLKLRVENSDTSLSGCDAVVILFGRDGEMDHCL